MRKGIVNGSDRGKGIVNGKRHRKWEKKKVGNGGKRNKIMMLKVYPN